MSRCSTSETFRRPNRAGCTSPRPARRPAEPTATVLRVDEVEVRRSPRARRWRLEVPWGEPARLTAPRSMSQVEVEQVLAEKRRLDRRAAAAPGAAAGAGAARGQRVGGAHRRPGARFGRRRGGGRAARGRLPADPDRRAAHALGLVLSTRHALLQLAARARAARGARLRGRARALPPARPDHSQRFWALVERRRPHWREQRDWLREHGPELLAFRPSE